MNEYFRDVYETMRVISLNYGMSFGKYDFFLYLGGSACLFLRS